jgi:hypothetical protein
MNEQGRPHPGLPLLPGCKHVEADQSFFQPWEDLLLEDGGLPGDLTGGRVRIGVLKPSQELALKIWMVEIDSNPSLLMSR